MTEVKLVVPKCECVGSRAAQYGHCLKCGGAIHGKDDPDASTWVPFGKLRFGAIFKTERGWRGIKAVDGCYSYEDGENFIFEDDTPCMPIILGGWLPKNEVKS